MEHGKTKATTRERDRFWVWRLGRKNRAIFAESKRFHDVSTVSPDAIACCSQVFCLLRAFMTIPGFVPDNSPEDNPGLYSGEQPVASGLSPGVTLADFHRAKIARKGGSPESSYNIHQH